MNAELEPIPTEPRLPLYLVSSSPCCVHASDSALILRSRAMSARRFPLAVISRIVSSVANSWEGGALALCLRSAIPVVFLDGNRGPAGWLLPREHQSSHFCELIDEALSLASWHHAYSNWLRAERNRVVSSWAVDSPGEPVPLHQLSAWRKRFVYQRPEDASPLVPALWRAAIDSLVLRILVDSGLRSIFHACDGQAMQLARDCATLACLHLFPEASSPVVANPAASASPDNAFLLRCFEARTETLRSRIVSALLRLHRILSEQLHSWR